MTSSDVTHTTSTVPSLSKDVDGTELFVQTWSPAKETAKAHVLVLHGYLEHGGRYFELAEYLACRGIIVTCMDCRGHGKSSGKPALVRRWSDYDDDLIGVMQYCQKYGATSEGGRTSLPIFVLGHSNGGLIVLKYFLDKATSVDSSRPQVDVPVAGILLSSPYLLPEDGISPFKFWVAKTLGSVLPGITVPASDLTVDKLTSDPDKQKEWKDDPLIVKHATLGWGSQSMLVQKQIMETVETVDEAALSTLPPMWVAHSQTDRVANPARTEKIVEILKKSMGDKLQTDVYPSGEHEIFNEPFRQDVFRSIFRWVSSKIGDS